MDLDISAELRRLAAEIDDLRERVTILEGAPAIKNTPISRETVRSEQVHQTSALTEIDVDEGASRLFVRAAVLCSCLIGALVLRVVTQNGIIGALPGTVFGLVYCGALLVLPSVLSNHRFLNDYGTLFQLCAVMLAPLIVLETFYKNKVFGPATSAAILSAFGVAAALVGARTDKRSLTTLALVVATLAIPALGMETERMLEKAALIVALSICAILIAAYNEWKFLPLIVLPIAAALIGFALLYVTRKPDIPAVTVHGLAGCALGLYTVIGIKHVKRFFVMEQSEAGWFPVATAWIVPLLLIYETSVGAIASSIVAVLLLAVAIWTARKSVEPSAGMLGIGTAGAVAGFIGFPFLHPSGVVLGAGSLLLMYASRKFKSSLCIILAQLQAVTASVVGLTAGDLISLESRDVITRLVGGFGLAIILFTVYAVSSLRMPDTGERMPVSQISWMSLLSGGTTFLFSCRLGAYELLGDTPAYQILLSFVIAMMCIVTQVLARKSAQNTLRNVGLLGVALFTAKVLSRDLVSLGAGYALLSVGLLMAVFVITSILFKKDNTRSENRYISD